MHEDTLIATLAVSLGLAFVFGLLALRVLQELAAGDELAERIDADEVVLAAVGLGGALAAGGVRDRQVQLRLLSEQGPDEGGLARARGGGDDEQPAALHGAGI